MLAMNTGKGKPEENVVVSHPIGSSIKLKMLIDTGADVSIVPRHLWPKEWPVIPASTAVVGVGGAQQTLISKVPVLIGFGDGVSVTT